METRIKNGDIVRHFKHDLVDTSNDEAMYLYAVLYVDAEDTVTGNRVVVYRALYGENKVYVRPYDEFVSEVDTKKYPNAKQKYRFEKI